MQNNSIPKAYKDVFNAFLVEKANYDGIEGIPCIKTSILLPEKVITFSNTKHIITMYPIHVIIRLGIHSILPVGVSTNILYL